MSLDKLHPHHWRHLLKFLTLEDKKNLKLVNKAIYDIITELDKSLKYAYKKDPITPAGLRQMAVHCPSLIGLEFTLCRGGLEDLKEAMNFVHKKHPTIEEVKLSFGDGLNYELIPPFRLEQISNGCQILTGLKCEFENENSEELNEAVDNMVVKHPELKTLENWRRCFRFTQLT